MRGNILIVDDHPIVQIGMRAFVERNRLFESTDVAGTGKEAVQFIKENKADKNYYQLAIVDINLPDYEATTLVRFIMANAPNTPILMFSMEPPKLYVQRLINMGVKGFLNKTSADDELLFAIKSIMAGRTYFSSDIMTEALNSANEQKLGDFAAHLSERESEILSLMIRGKSPGEICELLSLHKSSVATYRSRIFEKLGVSSNFELYQWAHKEGLILV